MMIESKKFTFKSKQDETILSGMVVLPKCAVGVVQLVHGMAEHKERYLPFMQYLAKRGYVCVIHDQRGHGQSVATNDDLGYFHDHKAAFLVEDIHQLSVIIKHQYPDLPLFLFGHSMGSLLVRAYCKLYDHEIQGLVVCGSPSKNPGARAGKLLVKLLKLRKDAHTRSVFINQLAFGSYGKRFQKDNIDSDNVWLCSNEKVVQQYDDDPLCGFVFSLNGFENLFDLMIDVYRTKGWQMKHPALPILFIAGKDDPCIKSEHDFQKAVSFMETRGYHHVENILYPGMRHEILNESDAEKVYQDILTFYEAIRNMKK